MDLSVLMKNGGIVPADKINEEYSEPSATNNINKELATEIVTADKKAERAAEEAQKLTDKENIADNHENNNDINLKIDTLQSDDEEGKDVSQDAPSGTNASTKAATLQDVSEIKENTEKIDEKEDNSDSIPVDEGADIAILEDSSSSTKTTAQSASANDEADTTPKIEEIEEIEEIGVAQESDKRVISEMLKRITGIRDNDEVIGIGALIAKTIDEKERTALKIMYESFLSNISNDTGVVLDNLKAFEADIGAELYADIKKELNSGKTPQEVWHNKKPKMPEMPKKPEALKLYKENDDEYKNALNKYNEEIKQYNEEIKQYNEFAKIFSSPNNSPFILLRDKLEAIEEARSFIYGNNASKIEDGMLSNLKRLNDEGKFSELINTFKQEKEKIKLTESQYGELEIKIAQKKMKEIFAYRSNLMTSTIELKSCLGSKMAILQQNQAKTGNQVSAYEAGQVKECFEKDYEKAKTNLEKAKEAPIRMLKDNMLVTPFALLIILAYAFAEAANDRIIEHYKRLKWWETNLYERFAKATPEERAEILKSLERAVKGANDETFSTPKELEKEDKKDKESVLNSVVMAKTNGKYSDIKTAMEEDYLNQVASETEILKTEANNPIKKMLDSKLYQDDEDKRLILKRNKNAREEVFNEFKFLKWDYDEIQKYEDKLGTISDKEIKSKLEALVAKLKDNAKIYELKKLQNKILQKEEEINKKLSEKTTDAEEQKKQISELNQELEKYKQIEKELKNDLKNVKAYTIFELEKEINDIKKILGNEKNSFIDELSDAIDGMKPKNGDRIAMETADILYSSLQDKFILYSSKSQFNHNLSVLKNLSVENIRGIEINNYIKNEESINKILSSLSRELEKIEDLEDRKLAENHIYSNLEQYRNGLLGKKPSISYEEFVMAINSIDSPAWKKNLEPTDDIIGKNGKLKIIQDYAKIIEARNREIDKQLTKLSNLSIEIDEAAYQYSENSDEYKNLVEEYKKTKNKILSMEYNKKEQGEDPLASELSKTYDYRIKQIYGELRNFDYKEESNNRIHTLLNGFANTFGGLANSYNNDNTKTKKEKDAELKKVFYELKSSLKLNATMYPEYQRIYDEVKNYSFKKHKDSLLEIAEKLKELKDSIGIEKAKYLKINDLRDALAEANKAEHNEQVVSAIENYKNELSGLKGKENDEGYRIKCKDAYDKLEKVVKKLKEEKNESALLVSNAFNFLRAKVDIVKDHIAPSIKDLTAEHNTNLVLKELNLKEFDSEKLNVGGKAESIIKEELYKFHKKIMGEKPEMNFKTLKENLKKEFKKEGIKDEQQDKIIQKLFARMDYLRLTNRTENYICKDYKSLTNARNSIEAVDFFNKNIKNSESLWGGIYQSIKNGHSDKLSLLSEVMPLDYTRLTIGGEVMKKLFDNFAAPAMSHDSLIDKNNITRILPTTLYWLNTHFRSKGDNALYQEKIDSTMAIMESAENLVVRQSSIDGKNSLIKAFSYDENGALTHCHSKYKFDALISNTEMPEKRSVDFAAIKNEHGQLLYGIYTQQTPGVHTTNDAMRFHNIFYNAGGKMQDMEKFARTEANANFLNMINPIGISKGLSNFQHKEVLSIYNHTKTANEILADFAYGVISHHQAANQLKELSILDKYGVKSAEKFMPATVETCKNLFNKVTISALKELDRIAEEKGLEILESTGVKLAEEEARKEKEKIKKKKEKENEEIVNHYNNNFKQNQSAPSPTI